MLNPFIKQQKFPMRYAKNVAKPYAFQALQQQIQACHQCPHCQKTNEHEPTLWGNPNATLLILLSWPDSSNDEKDYLQTALDYFQIDPDILAFGYACHCHGITYEEIRPPFLEEVKQCATYTQTALDIIEPLAVLCLSTFSSNLFYKQSLSDSIKEPSFIHNIPIFTTYPPSYILNLRYNQKNLFEAKHQAFYDTIQDTLTYLEKHYPNLALYQSS